MNGFTVFAGKEAREIPRTWRIWVLPGILLFFALTDPVLARFTPQIVGALGGNQLSGLKIPTPTYLDAYAQWTKDLSQIGLFALIIIYAGIISAETKSGTAVLVLTKPVSRTAFVIAKAAVHSVFLTVLVVLVTLVTWGAHRGHLREGTGIGTVVRGAGVARLRRHVHCPDDAALGAHRFHGGSCRGRTGRLRTGVDRSDLETSRHVLAGRPRIAARVAGSWQGRCTAVAGADVPPAVGGPRCPRRTEAPTQGPVVRLAHQRIAAVEPARVCLRQTARI